MELYGKALWGSSFLIFGSSATAIGFGGDAWNKNNPVAKTWLSDNHFVPRGQQQITDFTSNSNENYFALGCHKFLFGGQNFKQLYDENKVSSSSVKGTESNLSKDPLPISDLFTDDNEPLLGCSTAYLKVDNKPKKKTYHYELALRQGNKGFDERISIYEDKIISQLVFFEKESQSDPTKKPKYKHVFGLYRYIKQSQINNDKKTYKVANPNPDGNFLEKWSEIDLSASSSATNETQPRYYSVWVDDNKGEKIFDNLGVRSNNNPFSSVIKEQNSSNPNTSYFVHTDSKDGKSNELQKITTPSTHYALSVLDSLVNKIQERRGFWTPSKNFCSAEVSEGGRQHILEVKRLSQYCYDIKEESTKGVKSSR